MRIDPARHTVRLPPGARLDLAPAGGGYAADAALAALRGRGRPALVQAGDTVVVGDPPPDSDGWHVALPHAGAESAAGARYVSALARAGVSWNGGGPGGSGRPAGVRVTAVAPNGLTAAALAAAASAAGPAKSKALLDAFDGTTFFFADLPASPAGGRD